ncbi:hypothetical protein KL930_004053 [Ogataea haglerorum]|uniref:60S ribosomal protein L8 n=1 Tax=Ogataea haglerorum TaxID=1937702 RepID=A0ABQ7RMT9_9ASCO|nr:uncharacterized protein KL911_001397 [Ogataea haglerorum]KAG7693343.1 hypothetical protein KL915_004242 [Ogataea haglerorum]KAG7694252.1 hypothetical protein KL951_004130 [Ogataea haglerorum]KAG7711973.1 hypothetical protein KL914_000615 [Ogataea haglerorum]KAG7712744.1 hypothetical protein KL950_000615 [Ogataea haglerorum]KAG7722795.1 hypothetical protein KL913_000615 [Ogataea haglerorum]
MTEFPRVLTSMTQPSKKVAPAPLAKQQKAVKTSVYDATPRNYGIGQNIQPKRALNRFVKWPQYVRLQRQKKVLTMRLKVPPAIAQFSNTLDRNSAVEVFKLLNKYRPETKAEKKERLARKAAALADGSRNEDVSCKPFVVKYGLNHVVSLIEHRKAKLVLIANDVDPVELVVFLPALCRKMGIPYAIVKGKARLGTLVHQKTAAAVALVDVRPEDEATLAKLVSTVDANFAEKYEQARKQWGGGIMGAKTIAKLAKRSRVQAQ